MSARKRITAAQKATLDMDACIIPALDQLKNRVHDGNGAAIYYDHRAVFSALVDMRDAVAKALEIYKSTAWPTEVDYDTV